MMPERVWVKEDVLRELLTAWEREFEGGTAYVRADLYDRTLADALAAVEALYKDNAPNGIMVLEEASTAIRRLMEKK